MGIDTSDLVIEFDVEERSGRVLVTCEPNLDPKKWGYQLLGLASPLDMARGFPVLHAQVLTKAKGYASIFGWVQVITITDQARGATQQIVDVAPQLQGLEVPYLCFGPRPALFDAPSTDAQEETNWTANTFLVASPDCVMTRLLAPLCGFSWGYEVRERGPRTLAPTKIGAPAWSAALALLRSEHPSWIFSAWPC